MVKTSFELAVDKYTDYILKNLELDPLCFDEDGKLSPLGVLSLIVFSATFASCVFSCLNSLK